MGEHLELHTIWSVIVNNKRGYKNHPETQRWIGHLAALAHRHDLLVEEISRRGYNHKSPLAEIEKHAGSPMCYPATIEPIEAMRAKLAEKLTRS